MLKDETVSSIVFHTSFYLHLGHRLEHIHMQQVRLMALLSIEGDKRVREMAFGCIKGFIKAFNLFNIFIITETLF